MYYYKLRLLLLLLLLANCVAVVLPGATIRATIDSRTLVVSCRFGRWFYFLFATCGASVAAIRAREQQRSHTVISTTSVLGVAAVCAETRTRKP